MARKQASKTPNHSPRRIGKTGAANLLTGNPGNSGGGRPPDEFKAMCRQLASRAKTFEVAERILDNPEVYPSLYTGALKWATEQGYGKPKEHIEHTGEIKHGVVILPSITGK